MKRAAAFRVCPPSVLGKVRVFVRPVVNEMGETRGGSGEKLIFVGKKGKTVGNKNVSFATGGTSHHRSSRATVLPIATPASVPG